MLIRHKRLKDFLTPLKWNNEICAYLCGYTLMHQNTDISGVEYIIVVYIDNESILIKISTPQLVSPQEQDMCEVLNPESVWL